MIKYGVIWTNKIWVKRDPVSQRHLIFSDVLEFLQDIDVNSLANDLQSRYHKLLEDVTNAFYDPDEDGNDQENEEVFNKADNGEHEKKRKIPNEHHNNDTDDDDFVHFPPNSQNQNTAALQPYSYMVKPASENEHIYDETNLNQDYEPVTFGGWLG